MDTQKLTLDLLATGLTQQELADLLNCSQSTINAFSKGNRGVRPSYPIGKKLGELHAARCPITPTRPVRQGTKHRSTDPAPPPGRRGRQVASPRHVLDTVPDKPITVATKK